MSIAELVHAKEEHDVYLGRGKNGKDMITADVGQRGWLGNPYKIKEHGGQYTREQSLERYETLLRNQLENDPVFREAFKDLQGKKLGRWCSPDEDCHGDIIIQVLESVEKKSDEVEK